MEVSASEQNFNYSSEIETNSPVSFAGGIEGGVILADMWKFGFQFLSLGEPEFEFDQSVTQNGQTQTGNSEGDQPRAMFLIKLGIVFN